MKFLKKFFDTASTNANQPVPLQDHQQQAFLYIVTDFEMKHGINLEENAAASAMLKKEIVKFDRELREGKAVHIRLPYISATDKGPVDLDVVYSPDFKTG